MKKLVTKYFKLMGFKVIHYNEKESTNGVDMWVKKKDGKPLSVEIKKARKQKTGCYQVDFVQPNRINDDLIAIILNDKYVLIEEMKHHLSACSNKGFRQFTTLLK